MSEKLDRSRRSRVGEKVRRLGALGLSAILAIGLGGGVTACGGKDKKKPTTPSGQGKGSDAQGMNDGDPVGGDGAPGGGSGDGGGTAFPGGGGEDGSGGDGSGSGSAAEAPPILPPNLDIPPGQAKAEVDRHLNAGKAMLGQGTPDPDGAIREAKAALAVDGNSIDAQLIIAHAYYLKRLNDTAEVILDGLYNKRKASQTNPYLFYVYGLVYDRNNDATRAFAAYKQAVQLDPSLASAQINLGVHQLRNKQYADAVRTFEAVTGPLAKADAANLSSLGSAYRGVSADYQAGSPQRDEYLIKAENAYKRALSVNRNYGPAYYNLGLLYLDADPFPAPEGTMDTLVRLNRAKTYFDEYKNMPGVDLALYDERTKDVTKLIKREEKKRKKSAGSTGGGGAE